MKKIVLLSGSAFLVAASCAVVLVEVWVRLAWDPMRGRPGLFVSDPARVEKLAPNYDGWFAGVPVRTNALGFRDTREYRLEKSPKTFRILVLGDSVTFGHGSLYEHTYPRLLEERLRAWNPDVEWQVWNLGVPGYSTAQELAYLVDVGPRFQPDLVIVGFYENDVVEENIVHQATRRERFVSVLKTALRTHLYSFEWYKRQYLQLRYRMFASPDERRLLESLAGEEQLLARPQEVARLGEQQLTHPAALTDEQLAAERCPGPPVERFSPEAYEGQRGFRAWREIVREFQRLARADRYRIVFFANIAPRLCQTRDLFDPRSSEALNAHVLKILSDGTPAVSSHDAFVRYRPSQMPMAGGHSIGNSNVVKADVLFEFLRGRVLQASGGTRQVHVS